MSQPKKLSGKVAIVTASTDGIGFAIAERLAQDGASVMISSRKQQNVERAVESLKKKGLRVSGIACHVASKEQRQKMIEKTVEEFGGIDILVSNAAANPIMGTIFETTETAWDKIMEVNVKATFFLCKEVVPYMEKRGTADPRSGFIRGDSYQKDYHFRGGSIVLVSSIAGYNPNAVMGPYGISKTALLGMVKAMSTDCGARNIRINGLAPGLIETKFSEPLWKSDIGKEQKKIIPLHRFGKSEECASVVSMLVSEDGSYITGENIVVGGGAPSRL